MHICFPERDHTKPCAGKYDHFSNRVKHFKYSANTDAWVQRSLVAFHNRQSSVEHQVPLRIFVGGTHLGFTAIWRLAVKYESQHRIHHTGCAVSDSCP